MLLRRVIEHVKAQNWTAVALDFVIVVVGVLLAFQITGWGSEQRDQRDEKFFLERLHSDLLLAEASSARIRDRRLAVSDSLSSAIKVVFAPPDGNELTDADCNALGGTAAVYMNVLELAAFTELTSAGRIGILRDERLRITLVEFQQLSKSLNHHMILQTNRLRALNADFPEAMSRYPYLDDDTGEIRADFSCNLEVMQANQEIMQVVLNNADDFDAFVRDEFRPWSDKLHEVHERLDQVLRISHVDAK